MNHREAWDLIPWLVNERIDPAARASLQQHLEQCAECASEVRVQEALSESMHAAARVEAMPPASLQKLWARIDAEPQVPVSAPAPAPPAANEHSFRYTFAHVAAVAAVALLTGVAFTSALHGLDAPAGGTFRTVSDAVDEASGIRVVFDTTMSVARLQALLERHGLLIVSGPSASGVYTLGGRSSLQQPDATLTALRAEQEVRFAEPGGP